MYKYYELTDEEKEIEKAFANGLVKSVKISKNEMTKLKAVARNTLNKTKSISIRVDLKTLLGLKAKAIEEGIPYQTLAGSILHKYASQ